jgi:hypothetical protein
MPETKRPPQPPPPAKPTPPAPPRPSKPAEDVPLRDERVPVRKGYEVPDPPPRKR